MYKQIFTGQDYCVLAIYAHSGNKYHYYKIHKDGSTEPTKYIGQAEINEYYLDYLTDKQLNKISLFEEIFSETNNIIKHAVNISDDIPF